jgi:hypothetical protein
VGNPTYHPQSEINTQFGGIVPESGNLMLIHSNFTAQVSTPVINLDSFEVIPQVKCSSASSLQMTFNELNNLKHAQSAWSTNSSFAVMFTYDQSESCQRFGPSDAEPPTPDEVPRLLYKVTKVAFDEASLTGTLQGKFVSVMDTVGKYSMQVQQKAVHESSPPEVVPKDAHSRRRRLANWFKSLWKRDHSTHKEGHFAFNANYDPEKKAAKKPVNVVDRLTLPGGGQMKANFGGELEWLRLLQETTIQCSNCFAHGKINFKLTMTGNLRKRTYEYDLTMNGYVDLNMDWNFILHQGKRIEFPRINLFGNLLKLANIGVPGLLILKPMVAIDLMLAYKVLQPDAGVGFTMGAEVHFPLDLHLEGSSADDPRKNSKNKWEMTPKFKVHPVTRIPENESAQVELTVGLVPRIGLGVATLMKVDLMAVALELENNVEFNLEENAPHCTKSSKTKTLALQIMRAHRLQLKLDTLVSTHAFPIVGDRYPIPKCTFCNTCVDPNFLKNAKKKILG